MQYKKFKIDIYDWTIHYIEVESQKDAESVDKKMRQIGLPDSDIEGIVMDLANMGYLKPTHFFNESLHQSVLFVPPINALDQRLDTIIHEIYHIADQIKEIHGLEGCEAPAYIAGYIARKLTDIIYYIPPIIKSRNN